MKIYDKNTKEVIYEDDSPRMGKTVQNAIKKGITLNFADLNKVDLPHANLSNANLRYTDLREANLYGANLDRADLTEANLNGAYLRNAKLYFATLLGADLSQANLYGADLYRADLSYAKGIFSIGPIGKHNRIIYAFQYNDVIYVQAGCFNGTLEEFANAVIDEYGDDRAEYDVAIRLINVKFL